MRPTTLLASLRASSARPSCHARPLHLLSPRTALALLAAASLACADRPVPTDAGDTGGTTPAGAAAIPTGITAAAPAGGSHAGGSDAGGHAGRQRAAAERLARLVARSLADESFRRDVRAELDRSPVAERKVHFQRFLRGGGGHALRALARAAGASESAVASEADAALALELYFPVPAHRAAWDGGPDLLVATALTDDDTPVAFDLTGRRLLLDRTAPPATPVLALVPVETDFSAPAGPVRAQCAEVECSGGGGGSGSGTTVSPGLYLTASHLNESFESWLKGAPEVEILVLGQKGSTDSLTRYQCVNERAAGAYHFNQDARDWTGRTLLFSQAQLDAFRQQHPTQHVRLFFLEDDEAPCEIRNDPNRLKTILQQVDAITRGKSGGRDTTSSTIGRFFKYAPVVGQLYAALASLVNSNDDLIGNAVEDKVANEYYGGYNWILKGQDGRTNGYVKLDMQ
jgi:hypothetical protein